MDQFATRTVSRCPIVLMGREGLEKNIPCSGVP